MSAKKGTDLILPASGSLWYGCQSSLDEYLNASIKLGTMDPLELSEMSVKGREMRSVLASSEDRFANHYMVDTYGDGRLAVVSIQGALLHHPLPLRMFGMNVTTYNEIRDAITMAVNDPTVERILLAVGSGGGNGGGLFATSNFLEKAGKIKPLDTFTDSMMGSAAYWLGVNGKTIYSEPLADVGSIGVYVTLASRSRMLTESGIDVKVIRAGEFKALGHSDEPFSDKALETIQSSVDKSYDAFLEHTSSKRGQQKEAFRVKAAEGRVFTGTEAAEVGLVDSVMLFDEVLDKLLSAKRKTVPQGGRNQKMHEGSMDKLLELMQAMGVSLSADQQAALASGASLDSIGLAADVVAKLEAAMDETAEEGGEGDGEGADPSTTAESVDEGGEAKPTNLAGAGAANLNLGELIDKVASLSAELATVKAQLSASETARETLQAAADLSAAQLTTLKPIVAASVNRFELALRASVSANLESLSVEQLAERYEATKANFEKSFPTGQKSKTARESTVAGEARKLPTEFEKAASAATTI